MPFPYLCGERAAPPSLPCFPPLTRPRLHRRAVPDASPPLPPRLQCSHAGAGIGSDVRSICLLFCYLLTDPVNNRINRFLLFLFVIYDSVVSVIFVIFVNRFVIFVNKNLNLLFVNILFCYSSFLLTEITNMLTKITKITKITNPHSINKNNKNLLTNLLTNILLFLLTNDQSVDK